jgi:hypothetical protein
MPSFSACRRRRRSRSSAEVIAEAPSSSAGRVLPLADFGAVRFTAARVNGRVLRKLRPIKIVMIDRGRLAKDCTSGLGAAGGAFRNTWIRSS